MPGCTKWVTSLVPLSLFVYLLPRVQQHEGHILHLTFPLLYDVLFSPESSSLRGFGAWMHSWSFCRLSAPCLAHRQVGGCYQEVNGSLRSSYVGTIWWCDAVSATNYLVVKANSILFQSLEQPLVALPLCVLCSLQLVRASILPTPTTAVRSMKTETCESASGSYAAKTTIEMSLAWFYFLYSAWTDAERLSWPSECLAVSLNSTCLF